MEEAEIYLKWYHTFLFFFQTFLAVADTTTDILTSLEYKNSKHPDGEKWFAVSLGVTLVTLTVLCVWSAIASTLRMLTKQDDAKAEAENPDVIFRNPVVNILFSCFWLGPPLHSFQMFLVCAARFTESWKSDRGVPIEKGRLYYLYIHTLSLKMVEGLLESAPQLILQLYVMLMPGTIKITQYVSAPISFITLTWMITSMEVFREFANSNLRLHHNLIIFISNAGIIAARTVAVVAFTLVFPWWLALVFGLHCFLINACGYMLWRSERKQDMLIFIFAYSPLYLFIYSSHYLSKLRGNARFGFQLQAGLSIAWHLLFTAENMLMIFLYYKTDQVGKLDNTVALITVLVGNIGGMFLKSIMWHCCLDKDPMDTNRQRPITIRVLNRKNRA
ncbi:XK-related protein 8-like [Montipora foliosa]|uniref:XK-related protein 8-like n=1 Tax=Montipora foliosa TaxID=591990 RepID=UPI0035F16A70